MRVDSFLSRIPSARLRRSLSDCMTLFLRLLSIWSVLFICTLFFTMVSNIRFLYPRPEQSMMPKPKLSSSPRIWLHRHVNCWALPAFMCVSRTEEKHRFLSFVLLRSSPSLRFRFPSFSKKKALVVSSLPLHDPLNEIRPGVLMSGCRMTDDRAAVFRNQKDYQQYFNCISGVAKKRENVTGSSVAKKQKWFLRGLNSRPLHSSFHISTKHYHCAKEPNQLVVQG